MMRLTRKGVSHKISKLRVLTLMSLSQPHESMAVTERQQYYL